MCERGPVSALHTTKGPGGSVRGCVCVSCLCACMSALHTTKGPGGSVCVVCVSACVSVCVIFVCVCVRAAHHEGSCYRGSGSGLGSFVRMLRERWQG